VAFLLAVPSHPTTYLVSPMGYTADAVAAGASTYGEHCRHCHGPDGGGRRPGSLSPASAPLDLNDRVPARREGDLFWSIARGIPGTEMPGFADRLSDADIWSLIQFLDAQTAARHALALADRVRPMRPVPAPDFTYELIGQPQESLQRTDGRVTLLVFYTLPSSLPRLRELASIEPALSAAGARVLALPIRTEASSATLASPGESGSVLARASPAVVTTYLMFAGGVDGADRPPPAHLEYLVDRFGYLRVRWVGIPDPGKRPAETLRQVDLLVREPAREPLQWGHRH
jgi:putative copper resistance protein D